MTTTITALLIQAEFNTSIVATKLEYMIDSAIDTVNSDADVSISNLSGTAGSKTVSVTAAQAAAIKPLVAMKIASYNTSGSASSSTTLGPYSTSQSNSSIPNDLNMELYKTAIKRLRTHNFQRT